jgi:YVTN family beta-propeller protein
MFIRLSMSKSKPSFLLALIFAVATISIMITVLFLVSCQTAVAAAAAAMQQSPPKEDSPVKAYSMTKYNESYSGPIGVAVNPNTNMIYVSGGPSGAVSVIDGNSNMVVKAIKVGLAPSGIDFNPNTNMYMLSIIILIQFLL